MPPCLSRSRALLVAGHGLHKLNDGASNFRVRDLGKGLVELKTFPAAQKFDHVTFGGLFRESCGRTCTVNPNRGLFIKELNLYAEHFRKIEQPAGANSVDTLFVFLNLLKCQP